MGHLEIAVAIPRILFALVATLSAGCASHQEVATQVSTQVVGTRFDSFKIWHGVPYETIPQAGGDVAYHWTSGTSAVAIPLTATTTTISRNNTTQLHGGGAITMTCDLRLLVGPDGMIKTATIVKDTVGIETTSRCGEVFAPRKATR